MAAPFLLTVSLSVLFSKIMFLQAFTSAAMQPLCQDDERSALLQFKQTFYDKTSAPADPSAYPKVASWMNHGSETDCCLWDGVECDQHTGHVVGLDLSNSSLYGSINSNCSLFHLVHLRSLNLAGNDFNYSQIPSKLVRLSLLTSLNLSNSQFYGQIPLEITELSSLTSLDLGGNLLQLKTFDLTRLLQNLTSLEKLDLSYVNISSAMPDIFTNLSSLTLLDLKFCNLSGPLPSSLGGLTRLSYLSLENNNLSGHIPAWLANLTQLTVLSLSYNNFMGSLSWLGKQTKLEYLSLLYLNLVGEIPSSLRNLTHLRQLHIYGNKLTGQLPFWLSNLTQLTELYLGSNEFHGPIPQSIPKLVNLEALALQPNHLTGDVKIDMFTGLKNLAVLFLGGNNFSLLPTISANATLPMFEVLGLDDCNLREFPDFLRHQNQLSALYLSRNKLQGRIPKWIGNISRETLRVLVIENNFFTGFEQSSVLSHLRGLEVLNLNSNKLEGPLPIPPPSIFRYWLSNNSLTGEISPWMCKLSSLAYLDLSHNKLSGRIPECLGNLSDSLLLLNLANNSFCGSIPETFKNGSNLKSIDLSQNHLEGQLPRSLASYGMLETLDISENHITDNFPFWLGTLPYLEVLILRSNQFFGVVESPGTAIWFPQVRIIDLSHNNFVGRLPSEFFQTFSSLKAFDLNQFKYMGTNINQSVNNRNMSISTGYQVSLANKGKYTKYWKVPNVLAAVDLSSNSFQGDIPLSIGTLKMINVLNLSNNHFSGHIPSGLARLSRLESLDLSLNMLSGGIPSELTQLTSLAYFDVSHNQLVGRIPEGKQFYTFENGSYGGNAGLCGQPLSKKCENSEGPPPSKTPAFKKAGDSKFPTQWIIVLIGYGSGLFVGVIAGHEFATRNQERLRTCFGIGRKQTRMPRGGH